MPVELAVMPAAHAATQVELAVTQAVHAGTPVAAQHAAVVAASTVVAAADTAAADTGKFRLLARNEKPALLRQAGFFHARENFSSLFLRLAAPPLVPALPEALLPPTPDVSFRRGERQWRYDVSQVRGTSCKAHVFIFSCLSC
jgi:hypothetical protein